MALSPTIHTNKPAARHLDVIDDDLREISIPNKAPTCYDAGSGSDGNLCPEYISFCLKFTIGVGFR